MNVYESTGYDSHPDTGELWTEESFNEFMAVLRACSLGEPVSDPYGPVSNLNGANGTNNPNNPNCYTDPWPMPPLSREWHPGPHGYLIRWSGFSGVASDRHLYAGYWLAYPPGVAYRPGEPLPVRPDQLGVYVNVQLDGVGYDASYAAINAMSEHPDSPYYWQIENGWRTLVDLIERRARGEDLNELPNLR